MARIASVQMNCETGHVDETRARMLAYVDEACDNGAQLVILPEGIYQGYVFNSYDELYPLAEEIPAGTLTQALMAKAKERNTYIIAGLYEKEGVNLYNSAVFVGPDGYVGKYRKMHYWSTEKLYCKESETGFPVFDTKLGRIGIMICYDLWFPETMRLLTLQGADLIVTPTGWVMNDSIRALKDNPGNGGLAMPNTLCIAASHQNGVYIAASARVGEERGTKWVGESIITGPDGMVLAKASDDKEEIIYADVDLWTAKEARSWGPRTNLISDRRTDYYDKTLGLDAKHYIL